MKKIFALLVSSLMMVSLVACAGGEEKENGNNNANVSETKENEITFQGFTAVDTPECTVKITEIDPDDTWGYTIKTELENKSQNTTYMFSVESAAVNGVECETLFAKEFAPGKKANDGISLGTSTIEKNGITGFTDIEITMRIYDSSNIFAEDKLVETFHIYPYGEEKATKFVRESQETDKVIVDNEYVTVIVTGYDKDNIWGYTANLYLINKTDTEIMLSVNEASVNGYMADPFYAKSVKAGKSAFSSISWSDTVLEENGITEVQEIEFLLKVYDSNDWSKPEYFKQTVTLNP